MNEILKGLIKLCDELNYEIIEFKIKTSYSNVPICQVKDDKDMINYYEFHNDKWYLL